MMPTLVRQLERSREQLRALVPSEHDLAMASDPVALFRATGLEPDPWQIAALESSAPRLAFNIHRQGGKDQVAAALACHVALSETDALVLVLSPSLRQSQEQFRRILDTYRSARRPVPPEAENKLTLELMNGSRVVALPGTERTVRGFAGVKLLIVNEAARVADELFYAVRPMLAVSGGRLVTLSTPWGRRGWWHRELTENAEAWERYRVAADECPRISAAFLAEEKRSLGDLFFKSEYLCSFEETVNALFAFADIQAALDPNLTPLFPIGGADAHDVLLAG